MATTPPEVFLASVLSVGLCKVGGDVPESQPTYGLISHSEHWVALIGDAEPHPRRLRPTRALREKTARGVDAGIVQQWLGHESIATTNRYLHFLGTAADLAGLERLNFPRVATGVPNGEIERGQTQRLPLWS
jgi:hypothetical protein